MSEVRSINPVKPPPLADLEQWIRRRLFESDDPCWMIRHKKSGLVHALACGPLTDLSVDVLRLGFHRDDLTCQRAYLTETGGLAYGPECAIPAEVKP